MNFEDAESILAISDPALVAQINALPDRSNERRVGKLLLRSNMNVVEIFAAPIHIQAASDPDNPTWVHEGVLRSIIENTDDRGRLNRKGCFAAILRRQLQELEELNSVDYPVGDDGEKL